MPQHIPLKDPGGEARIFIARTLFSVLLVLALLGVILRATTTCKSTTTKSIAPSPTAIVCSCNRCHPSAG